LFATSKLKPIRIQGEKTLRCTLGLIFSIKSSIGPGVQFVFSEFTSPFSLKIQDFEKPPNPRHEQNEVLRYARLCVAIKKAQKGQFFLDF